MNARYARVETLNIHGESARLTPEALARWQGLAVGWFDAGPSVSGRDFLVPRRLLGCLDAGRAQARFDFGHGDESYDLRAGALRVYDGIAACRRNDWACESVRRIMVDLDGQRLGEPELLAGLRQDLYFRDDDLLGVVRAMVREVAEGCPHGPLYAQSLSMSVLLRIAQTHGKSPRERDRLTPRQMRRVDELIAASAGAAPTLDDMALAAGYSKAQFVRLFRRTLGLSPHGYVLRQRMEQARRLIVDSTLPLAHVASETGFASQSHLTHTFVRLCGCTPGELRRAGAR